MINWSISSEVIGPTSLPNLSFASWKQLAASFWVMSTTAAAPGIELFTAVWERSCRWNASVTQQYQSLNCSRDLFLHFKFIAISSGYSRPVSPCCRENRSSFQQQLSPTDAKKISSDTLEQFGQSVGPAPLWEDNRLGNNCTFNTGWFF